MSGLLPLNWELGIDPTSGRGTISTSADVKIAGTMMPTGPLMLQPTGGTVSRNLDDILADAQSVKNFGVVGDGVTNDAPALQLAFSWADGNGLALYIPAGTYLLNSTCSLVKGLVSVIGAPGATIVNGQTNAPAIKLGNGSSDTHDYFLSGLTFAQASGVTATLGNVGLLLSYVQHSRFENLTATFFPAALYRGVEEDHCTQNTYNSVQIQNCLNDGYHSESSNDSYMVNCRSDANGSDGFYIDNLSGAYFANCTAGANGNHAWQITGTSINLFCTNCVGDSSGNDNWYADGLSNAFLVNCWGCSQPSRTTNPTAAGFKFVSSACNQISILGGTAQSNNGHGLWLASNGSSAPTDISIAGFLGVGGNGQGASGGYGMMIDSGAVNITVTGGSLLNNITGPYSEGAATNVALRGVLGYINDAGGSGSFTSDATGKVTIPHGMATLPTIYGGVTVSGNVIFDASGSDATNIYLTAVNPATGGAIVNTALSVMWFARRLD